MTFFLDGLAVFFIILLGTVGYKRGFIEELGRLIGLIAAILVSISNSSIAVKTLMSIIQIDPKVGVFISFSLLFVATLIVGRVFTKFLHIALLSKSNQAMNNILGFIFGSAKGGFVIMVFIWFIAILQLQKWTNIIEGNSRVALKANQFRRNIVNFFNWEDPIMISESYIKELTQP